MFDVKYETMDRDELAQLQIERLQLTLNRVYRNVAFYRQTFDAAGVHIETIKRMDAIRSLPFTTREDLAKSYPYDMFAVPLKDVVRIHSTPGTSGRTIVVGYTKNDLRHWTDCAARLLTAAGVTEQDVAQIAFHYDLFSGGFGFHQGAERIGASVIPTSATMSLDKQATIMRDYKTTVLVSTPSFACNLAAALAAAKVHPAALHLRVGLFGAEPWSEDVRRRIEETLHLSAIDSYGLTAVMGPGIAGECTYKDGLHVNEDHCIVEVIDPKTLEPVPAGEEGELVFTTITKEAFPVIRYRTGDLSALVPGKCRCGRTLVRMRRVGGHLDNRIFFDGRNVFLSQIARVLGEVEAISPHFQVVLDRKGGGDTIEIKVEVSEEIPSMDELKTLERLRVRIVDGIEVEAGIKAKVTFVEPKTLARSETGEVTRVVDNRR